MTSYNEERFDLKMQFQPTQRTEGASEFIRKKPASKPKKDFEKVMKRKDDDDDEKKVFTRKEGIDEKKEDSHKQNLGSQIREIGVGAAQSTAYEGLASREGFLPEMKGIGAEAGTEKTSRTEFMQEQADLSGIQPAKGPQQAVVLPEHVPEVDRSKAQAALKKVQEIIDQIVQKIYTLEQKGKTETVLTLRHPPLFEGAQLKLTEFDSARREFNITFSNLRPDAKAIIDAFQAQNALQRALEQRGYVAHIVVVTTEKEEPIAAKEQAQSRQEGESQYEREQKQQQQQQQQQQG